MKNKEDRKLSEVNVIRDELLLKELFKVNEKFKPLENDIFKIIEDSGILLEGHFELLNKRHSKYLLRFSKLTRSPDYLSFVAGNMCNVAYSENADVMESIDAVLGPETAGSALVWETSRFLQSDKNRINIDSLIAKTDGYKKPISIINYLEMQKGDNVLIFDDVLTSGKTIDGLINLSWENRIHPQGLFLFSNRNNKEFEKFENCFKFVYCMTNFTAEDYKKSKCPLCEESKAFPEYLLN